jgi:uncharacterized protein
VSRDFPDWINPWNAAEGRRIFEGTLPLERFTRLAGLLAETRGLASFQASFELDGERRPVIDLEVSADLPLTCQASLETYLEPVSRKTLLGVVASADEIELLPSHYEPVLVEEGRLAMARLVEDELLLGLPQVPRKPNLASVAWSSLGETERAEPGPDKLRRPFAALGALLGNRDDPADPD